MEYENHLHESQSRWFAVYTRFRREKVVERLLEEKGIEVYLPIQQFTRRYTRKIKQVEIPLFSCYVFVRIVKDQYVPVLETEHVVRFVQFKKNLIAIPQAEIDLVKRVLGERIPLELMDAPLTKGDAVEIIGGNLTGLKGQCIEIQGKKNFVIALENMGYALRMEIDPSLLRRIPRSELVFY